MDSLYTSMEKGVHYTVYQHHIQGDGITRTFPAFYPPGDITSIALNGCPLVEDKNYKTAYSSEGKVVIYFFEPPSSNDVIGISYKNIKHYYFWCPNCLVKYRIRDQIIYCVECSTEVIPLDINEEVFQELPVKSTQLDIVDVILGKVS